MREFDVRNVTQAKINLVKELFEGDRWMQSEMTDRHKGIAAESSFSLAMFRWVHKIIQFVEVSNKLDKIGISEIDSRIEKAQELIKQID